MFSSTTFTPIEHHNYRNYETSLSSPNGQRSKTVMEEKNFVLKIWDRILQGLPPKQEIVQQQMGLQAQQKTKAIEFKVAVN